MPQYENIDIFGYLGAGGTETQKSDWAHIATLT